MATNPDWYMKSYFSKNWKEKYKKYLWTADAILDRSSRNKARKKAWLKVGDKREIDHKNWSPRDNSKSNIHAVSRTYNRKKWGASKKRTDWKLG